MPLANNDMLRSIRLYSTKVTNTVTLKKPQFNIKAIIDNADVYKASVMQRELPSASSLCDQIDSLRTIYQTKKDHEKELINLGKKRKSLESQLRSGATEEVKSELFDIKTTTKSLQKEIEQLESSLYQTCENLPNLIDPSVGSEQQLVKYLNPLPEYVTDPELSHHDIGPKLGLVDFKSGTITSGTSFYYLLNDGALLEQALVQYALKKARKSGFKMCLPPSVVKNEVIGACGFKPRDQNGEQQIYTLDNTLGLTATAEIPLAALGINAVFKNLPQRKVGVSRSYRAEAGARGKDTKGLYRVHEFTKVELFVWATQEQSVGILEDLLKFQMEIITELGIPARVLNMPFNDLGNPAYKKYDIEAWMPGRGSWGELTSSSNCTDFQARRMNTKYNDGELKYAHTLNGTAMAVPRVIVALIENGYDKKRGLVRVPEVLREYMDGKEWMGEC